MTSHHHEDSDPDLFSHLRSPFRQFDDKNFLPAVRAQPSASVDNKVTCLGRLYGLTAHTDT